MKRIWLLVLLMAGSLVALNVPVFADETSTDSMEDINAALGSLSNRVNNLEKKGPSVEIHGFAELDYIYDTTEMGLGTETIGDSAQIPKGGTLGNVNGQTQFSPRNSRFDFLAQQSVGGWMTKGYVEGDFLGITNNTSVGGTENKEYTQPTFRIRHAYMDAQSDGWDIMAGQYWTLFGWNMDNVLATLDVSPIMGTLYERTPRLGIMKTIGDDAQVQIALDAERPEQAMSGIPNFNGGLRIKLNDWESQFAYATGGSKLVPLSIGISGTLRTYEMFPYFYNLQTKAYTQVTGQGPTSDITGDGIAIDAQIPVLTATAQKDDVTMILCGEWMTGYGVADALNGWNGGGATAPAYSNGLDSGIAGTLTNANGAVSLINDTSYNVQMQFHLPQSIGTYLTVGYGETYSNNARSMSGASYNDVNGMFANLVQDFTGNIRAGVEYSRFQDNYFVGSPVDHRLQLSTWYRF